MRLVLDPPGKEIVSESSDVRIRVSHRVSSLKLPGMEGREEISL